MAAAASGSIPPLARAPGVTTTGLSDHIHVNAEGLSHSERKMAATQLEAHLAPKRGQRLPFSAGLPH
ncbi:hypothetical protein NDU88_003260 [Pleurodeles waltl]|uniref:Uncharacterized protein n=1 Tax=Pleurodeles waltl TaxID=8319 RepID=A0AAV7SEY8_PLEWA|nr:hypothetical protein NDU88_003260 [Pleurodeles waltl]